MMKYKIHLAQNIVSDAFPPKQFRNFSVVLSQTFAMCDVSDQEVRSPDFTFASKQRSHWSQSLRMVDG